MSCDDLMVLEGNEALGDVHINTSLTLLKRQFPHYGLKHVSIPADSSSERETLPLKGIYIINVSNNYWVCCSTISGPEDTIRLYDSTHTYNINDQSLVDQLNALFRLPSFNIQVMECQESSHSDSGVHAIANATVLCYGLATERFRGSEEEPSEWYDIENCWNWDKDKMREHLKKCFIEGNILTPFPNDARFAKMTKAERKVLQETSPSGQKNLGSSVQTNVNL